MSKRLKTFVNTVQLIIFISFNALGQQVDVTFKVDMEGINTTSGVYVGSDWAGWDLPLFQEMTDPEEDGVFEITVSLPTAASYNYRYTIGNIDWNHFEDLSGSTCGSGPNLQDRNIIVPAEDTALSINCFNSCSSCSTTTKTYLTLRVDMSLTQISPDGIHVAGTFNAWDPTQNQLTDENGDLVFETTILVTPNKTFEYKFFNGHDWGKEELVFGTCEFRSNRLARVTNESLDMPTVLFNYCDEDASPISGVKIACVGNSITHGQGTSDLYTKCWPVQLRDLLGDGYYAENLGVSGSTMLKTGDLPWVDQPQYNFTFSLEPDIIVIKLGTNDSKAANWNAENYKADYIDLISAFRNIDTQPTIYMVAPSKAFSDGWGIRNSIIENEIIPIVKEIAFEYAVNVIDMYSATINKSANFPDGIHPNDTGAELIATKIKENITTPKPIISKIVQQDKSKISEINLAYQWFLNGTPLENTHSQIITVRSAGKYQVAVKPSNSSDDIFVSAPFQFTPEDNETSAELSTDITIVTGIKNSPNFEEVLTYPNPTSNTLMIDNANGSQLLLFNTAGKILYTKKKMSKHEEIDVSNLNRGICFIKISFGLHDSKTYKLILD